MYVGMWICTHALFSHAPLYVTNGNMTGLNLIQVYGELVYMCTEHINNTFIAHDLITHLVQTNFLQCACVYFVNMIMYMYILYTRSPGGTPMKRRDQVDREPACNDPAAIIAQALRRKFANKMFQDSPSMCIHIYSAVALSFTL